MKKGIFNQHNLHYYTDENPFVTRPKSFQDSWKVWGGIIGDNIMIHLLSDVFNVSIRTHTYTHPKTCKINFHVYFPQDEQYAVFLEETLLELLDD